MNARARTLMVYAASTALLALLALLSLAVGAVDAGPGELLAALGGASKEAEGLRAIIFELRLPRTIAAVFTGGGLAVAGACLQAYFRNPMAEPYVVGVSAGAGLGAITLMTLFTLGPAVMTWALPAGAFAGALGAIALVAALAQRRGAHSPDRLLLTGIAVSLLATALMSLLIVRNENTPGGVFFWLLGSVASNTFAECAMLAGAALAGTAAALLLHREMDALLWGESNAAGIGVDVARTQRRLLVISAFVSAVAVALCGVIGFVGLIVPHGVRMLVGAAHRRVIPLSLIGGGVLLLAADIAARLLSAPAETPLGVVTSLIGVPFFLLLLQRKQ